MKQVIFDFFVVDTQSWTVVQIMLELRCLHVNWCVCDHPLKLSLQKQRPFLLSCPVCVYVCLVANPKKIAGVGRSYQEQNTERLWQVSTPTEGRLACYSKVTGIFRQVIWQ